LAFWMPTITEAMKIQEVDEYLLENGAREQLTDERFNRIAEMLEERARITKHVAESEMIHELKCIHGPLWASDSSSSNNEMALGLDTNLLYRATSVFQCNICVASGYVEVSHLYGYLEALHHIQCHSLTDTWHLDPGSRRPFVDRQGVEMAIKIVEQLGLPTTATHADLSGKVSCLCQCPTFEQPTPTLGTLLDHIRAENQRYEWISFNIAFLPLEKGSYLLADTVESHSLYSSPPLVALAESSAHSEPCTENGTASQTDSTDSSQLLDGRNDT